MEEVEDEDQEEDRNQQGSHTHISEVADDTGPPHNEPEELQPVPSKHSTLQQKSQSKTSMDEREWNRQVSIEEVEDEDVTRARNKLTSPRHLLFSVDDTDDQDDRDKSIPLDKDVRHTQRNKRREAHQNTHHSESMNKPIFSELPPPPTNLKPIHLHKKQQSPPGTSSMGVSVLSTKGWVTGLENGRIDLWLDSCADITLISKDFFNTLKNAPHIQQGIRMKLWQLMDKNEELKGFIRIPVFMETADGVLLESEAEAYIVPRMTIPILLGEDYQLNYELGVTRNVEAGTKIHFAGMDHEIAATCIDQTADFDRMRQSTMLVNKFAKAKSHRHGKAR